MRGKNYHRGTAEFTHFASIPFIRQNHRQMLSKLQKCLIQEFSNKNLDQYLQINNPNLFHLTLSMLTLSQSKLKERTQQIMYDKRDDFMKILKDTKLTTDKIGYFTRYNKNGPKFINIIYLDLKEDEQYEKIRQGVNYLIKTLLKEQIIVSQQLKSMNIEYDHNSGMYRTKKSHITLFRCRDLVENNQFKQIYEKISNIFKNQQLQCDSIDISTRFVYDETKFYKPLQRISINQQLQ